MKRASFIIAVILMSACTRIPVVDEPSDFNVTCDRYEVKTGEIVQFNFVGDPDVISFYSGEFGNDYNYIHGRTIDPEYRLTFDEQAIDGTQENQLKVMVSSTYDSNLTWESADAHKGWVDISDRFTLLGPGKVTGNRAYTNVGYADISDFLTDDDTSLAVAFHYTGNPWVLGQDFNIIRVKNCVIKSYSNGAYADLYGWNDFGWEMVTKFAQQSNRPSEIQENNKVIQFRVGWGAHENDSGTYQGDGADNWAVSEPLTFQKSLDMGPDKAIGVKGVNDVKKSYFQHTYSLPGEYQVVFIAKNVNASGLKEKIVKLNITVTE